MKKRRLGSSDLDVSAFGLGCFSMTPIYGNPDPADGIATIHRALELGINHLDTADAYAGGTNEQLIARAIAGKRDQVVLATKFGQLDRDGKRVIDGRPEYARSACEASLRRLGVDHIDLYYQHRVDASTPVEDTAGEISTLIEEGKVRAYGISEAAPETVARAHNVCPVTAIQMEYSVTTRFVEDEHLPQCERLDIALVAYAPIGRGFLTGQIRSSDDLGTEGETRGAHPRFAPENLARNIALLEPIEQLARDKGCTMAQLAIAWVDGAGDTVFPLAGSGKIAHLEENVAAMDVTLDTMERKALSDAVDAGAMAGERYPPHMMGHLNV